MSAVTSLLACTSLWVWWNARFAIVVTLWSALPWKAPALSFPRTVNCPWDVAVATVRAERLVLCGLCSALIVIHVLRLLDRVWQLSWGLLLAPAHAQRILSFREEVGRVCGPRWWADFAVNIATFTGNKASTVTPISEVSGLWPGRINFDLASAHGFWIIGSWIKHGIRRPRHPADSTVDIGAIIISQIHAGISKSITSCGLWIVIIIIWRASLGPELKIWVMVHSSSFTSSSADSVLHPVETATIPVAESESHIRNIRSHVLKIVAAVTGIHN